MEINRYSDNTDPHNLQKYIEKGKALISENMYCQAKEAFNRALELDAEDEQALFELGKLYFLEKDYPSTIRMLIKLTDTNSNRAEVYLLLAKALIMSKDYAGAFSILKNGSRISRASSPGTNSCDVEFNLELGKIYAYFTKEYSLALGEFEEGRSKVPGNFEFLLEIGRIYIKRQEYEKAIEELEAGKRIAPENVALRFELGRAYLGRQEYEKAIEELEVGKRAEPDNFVLRLGLGRAYAGKQEYEKAMEELRAGERIVPDSFELHFEMARIHMIKREQSEALREYGKAIEELILECENPCTDIGMVEELKKCITYDNNNGIKECKGKDYFVNKQMKDYEIFKVEYCFSKPISLFIFITRRCNIKCIMCGAVENSYPDLPHEAFSKIWAMLSCVGVIDWIGGEVFLVRYFKDVLTRIKMEYPYIKHNITTNGLLINSDWAELLASLDVHIVFSIDSVVKSTYESIRKGANYDKLIKNLELVRSEYLKKYPDKNYFFEMNVVVMKRNMQELRLFPGFCRKHGIGHLRFSYLDPQLIPMEDIFADNDKQSLECLSKYIGEVENECAEFGISFECNFKELISIEKEQACTEGEEPLKIVGTGDISDSARTDFKVNKIDHEKNLKCVRPWVNLLIDYDGSVRPSCECTISVGNILSHTLEEIWNGDAMRMYRRKLLEGTYEGWCTRQCVILSRDIDSNGGQMNRVDKSYGNQ